MCLLDDHICVSLSAGANIIQHYMSKAKKDNKRVTRFMVTHTLMLFISYLRYVSVEGEKQRKCYI